MAKFFLKIIVEMIYKSNLYIIGENVRQCSLKNFVIVYYIVKCICILQFKKFILNIYQLKIIFKNVYNS